MIGAEQRIPLLIRRDCIRRRDLERRRARRHGLEVEPQLRLELARGRRVILLHVHHGHVVVIFLLQWPVGPEGVVLPACPHPQPLLRGPHARHAPDLLLELQHRVLFLDPERRHIIRVDEVEEAFGADLRLQISARGDAYHSVQVRLESLLLLARLLLLLLFERVPQVRGDVISGHVNVDVADCGLAHVHKHVRGRDLRILPLGRVPRGRVMLEPAVLPLDRLLLLHLGHALVVKLKPLLHAERPNEGIVMAAVGPS